VDEGCERVIRGREGTGRDRDRVGTAGHRGCGRGRGRDGRRTGDHAAVLAVDEAGDLIGEYRNQCAVDHGSVVGGDRQGRWGDAERAVDEGCERVIRGREGAGRDRDRVGTAGHRGCGRGRGRDGRRADDHAALLAVAEAGDLLGECRNRCTVDHRGVVGGDRQGCRGDGEGTVYESCERVIRGREGAGRDRDRVGTTGHRGCDRGRGRDGRRTGDHAAVLAVDEAGNLIGEYRNQCAVDHGSVVGGDRQGCRGDGERTFDEGRDRVIRSREGAGRNRDRVGTAGYRGCGRCRGRDGRRTGDHADILAVDEAGNLIGEYWNQCAVDHGSAVGGDRQGRWGDAERTVDEGCERVIRGREGAGRDRDRVGTAGRRGCGRGRGRDGRRTGDHAAVLAVDEAGDLIGEYR